jgi:hypothetical protein
MLKLKQWIAQAIETFKKIGEDIKALRASLNGKADLIDGKVPADQLPSYVDDVIDLVNIVTSNPTSGMTKGNKYYNSTSKKILTATSATAVTESDPVSDAIYVNTADNTVWRWSGTALVQLSGGLVLGETATTAYRGDRGKTAYDHSQLTSGNPHKVTKSDVGLANADNTSDAAKPVSTATQTALDAKADKVRKINPGTGLTGGGDLTADRTLTVSFATNAEAGAGTLTTKALNPAAMAAALDTWVGDSDPLATYTTASGT